MKKVVVFLAFVAIVSIGLAESPDVSSGKGTVIPSKYDVTSGTAIPKVMDTSSKDEDSDKTISQKPGTTVPINTSVSNALVSMTQSKAEETNTTMESLRASFPSLTSFVSLGKVQSGAKIKVPSGAKYFIALVNGKWVSYPIPTGADIFLAPVDSLLTYFAW